MKGRSSQGKSAVMEDGSHMTEHTCDSIQEVKHLGSSLYIEDYTGPAKEIIKSVHQKDGATYIRDRLRLATAQYSS